MGSLAGFVNTHWLLGQCCWELHSYLRACRFYVQAYASPEQVKVVGCREWEIVVLTKFESLLAEVSAESNENDKIHVQDGKARLQSNASGDKAAGVTSPLLSSEHDKELQLLHEIDRVLTNIVVRRDGGHQITLGLLLHRYPEFKKLLGGRDLWQLYRQHGSASNEVIGSTLFQDVVMFLSDKNEVVLQSKRPKTTVLESGDENDDNATIGSAKRMKVDEEGLFSVTNRKWGRAMANFMVRACQEVNLFDDNDDESSKKTRERIAIDLTASVGGMTLGLAKAKYFDRVVAVEIDETRAKLCQDNMQTHGFDDLVEVRNKDSVEHLPMLPRNACMVIDPPWGGFDYKGLVREQAKKTNTGRPRNHLKLGDTLLEDVLEKIAHHNAPCVVGVRLPINYDVNAMLLECLEERNVEHKAVLVCKVGVQLFAVIHFPGARSRTSLS